MSLEASIVQLAEAIARVAATMEARNQALDKAVAGINEALGKAQPSPDVAKEADEVITRARKPRTTKITEAEIDKAAAETEARRKAREEAAAKAKEEAAAKAEEKPEPEPVKPEPIADAAAMREEVRAMAYKLDADGNRAAALDALKEAGNYRAVKEVPDEQLPKVKALFEKALAGSGADLG